MTDSEYFSYSLTDSSFISNSTSYGGVAHIRSASVTATDCTFTLNVAHVYGGAAQVLGSGTFTANGCFSPTTKHLLPAMTCITMALARWAVWQGTILFLVQ